MYIYYIELLIVWLLGFLCFGWHAKYYKEHKLAFLFFSLLMLGLVLGLRSNSVGEDTNHYVDIFNSVQKIPWKDVFTKLRITWRVDNGFQDQIENGFIIIAKLVYLITENPQAFLLLVSMFTMLGVGKFIYDNSEDVFFSTYIFMCECLYMCAFNGARQVLAISIGINAYTQFKRQNIVNGLMIVFVAMTIHSSAVIMSLLFVVTLLRGKEDINYKNIMKYVCIICAAIPLLIPIVEKIMLLVLPRYATYFSTNFWSVNIGGTSILWIIELVLVWCVFRKNDFNVDSLELVTFVLIYLTFEAIAFKIAVFERVAWYYRAFLMLFFPYTCRCFNKKKNATICSVVILFLVTVAFLRYAAADSRFYSFFLH